MRKLNYEIICDKYSPKQKANALVKETISDLTIKAKVYANFLYNSLSKPKHEEEKAYKTLKSLGYNPE